jgi:hypothetical protein
MLELVFAGVAALALDVLAMALIWSIGFHVAKRQFEQRQSAAFTGINRALTILTAAEIETALASSPNKIVGLLQAGTAKGQQKAQGDNAAREAEFK